VARFIFSRVNSASRLFDHLPPSLLNYSFAKLFGF
jgi:hypothetical protein